MNTSSSKSSSKVDRKTIEKNRRAQMKFLYSQLNSLVHDQHASSSSTEPLSLPDQIDKATEYVKKLKENVANLKRQKENLTASNGSYKGEGSSRCRSKSYGYNTGVEIEIYEKGNAIEVILVTGLECQFVFTEALRIIHDEHAEIVNATYSVNANIVFHTIHAQIKEDSTSHGVARITERLKMFAL
ncbi:unnamed protein product [Amaranthus hypochondriacus]